MTKTILAFVESYTSDEMVNESSKYRLIENLQDKLEELKEKII